MKKWLLVLAVLGSTTQAMAFQEVLKCSNEQKQTLNVVTTHMRVSLVNATLGLLDEGGVPVSEEFSGASSVAFETGSSMKFKMNPSNSGEVVTLQVKKDSSYGLGRCGRCSDDSFPEPIPLLDQPQPVEKYFAKLVVGAQEYKFTCTHFYK